MSSGLDLTAEDHEYVMVQAPITRSVSNSPRLRTKGAKCKPITTDRAVSHDEEEGSPLPNHY